MRRMLTILLGSASSLLLWGQVCGQWREDFDEDPITSGSWELYEPVTGSTMTTDDGFFRFQFPVGTTMDHWNTVDNAVQLRRPDFPEDFTLETRVNFLGSGDPSAPLDPLNEPYHAALLIYFSQYDVYYFGFYRGTPLWLERSGTNAICVTDPLLRELSLQVRKTGTEYSFSWRQNDTDDWQFLCSQTKTETPQQVGLIFKTWGGLSTPEIFDFDYIACEEVVEAPPEFSTSCPFPDPDRAWLGAPYTRELRLKGYPDPVVTVKSGQPGLFCDTTRGIVTGWIPDTPGTFTIELEAENSIGKDATSWNVQVASPSAVRDDNFDEDPSGNAFWSLYEPQLGVIYSIFDDLGTNWWRMEVPTVGEFGQDFDAWVGADRAPQLRHEVGLDEDFLVETRLRIAGDILPPATGAFLAGLMVNFSDAWDVIHWNLGGERTVNLTLSNVFAERSGINNLCNGYVDGIMTGRPVELRLEKRCDLYSFFFRGDGDDAWTLCGTYRTASVPAYVGLIMKTWGGGQAWTVDFDYFTYLKPGPEPLFTVTPAEGTEPLEVTVDATGSSSPNGAITAYAWDFGDGSPTATDVTLKHSYASRGTYTIRLTVTDATGDTGTASKLVQVNFRSEDVSPWISEDIGAEPRIDGGARLEAPDCLRVFATGSDISGRADQFHFVYQKVSGDSSITVRLSSVKWRLGMGPKVGVMAREDMTPGSRFAAMVFTSLVLGEKFAFIRRETADGAAPLPKNSTDKFTVPEAWVKLERKGEELIGSYSLDGSTWNELSRVTLAGLPAEINVGIAATARDTATESREMEALLCEVKLEGGAPPKPVFRRGDSDAKGGVPNITDGIFVLNFLFLGGPEPPCKEAANADDKGGINITDGIYILNYLFQGGPAPPAPGPDACGPEPAGSQDDVGCNSYPGEC